MTYAKKYLLAALIVSAVVAVIMFRVGGENNVSVVGFAIAIAPLGSLFPPKIRNSKTKAGLWIFIIVTGINLFLQRIFPGIESGLVSDIVLMIQLVGGALFGIGLRNAHYKTQAEVYNTKFEQPKESETPDNLHRSRL